MPLLRHEATHYPPNLTPDSEPELHQRVAAMDLTWPGRSGTCSAEELSGLYSPCPRRTWGRTLIKIGPAMECYNPDRMHHRIKQ